MRGNSSEPVCPGKRFTLSKESINAGGDVGLSDRGRIKLGSDAGHRCTAKVFGTAVMLAVAGRSGGVATAIK